MSMETRMKEKICLLGVVLVLVFVCGTAQATDYYVSSTGDDTAAGTIGAPWASPSRGARVFSRGTAIVGATEILTNDTQGFLPSGNIKIGATTLAYTSKTDTSFNLTSPLGAGVAEYSRITDADILGGSGFAWADVVNLSGTFTDQMIRIHGPYSRITYQTKPGDANKARLEVTDLELMGPRQRWAPGVIYNDGDYSGQYTEDFIIKDLEIYEAHADMSVSAHAINFKFAYNFTIDNCDITATGNEAAGINVYTTNYGSSITNSVIYAADGPALRMQGYGAHQVNLSYSVLGGPTTSGGPYGNHAAIVTENAGPGFFADHLTIVGFERVSVDMTDHANATDPAGTAWLKNSIIVDNAGVGGEALFSGGGNYNNVFNNAGGDYGTLWGASAGPDDTAIDPAFWISGFSEEDPDRSDPLWLRYDPGSALATAGEGGTYMGAFEPVVPEPATLVLLVISGIGAALLRRRS